MSSDFLLRSATAEDTDFIVEMARHACVIEDWPLPDADAEDTQSLLQRNPAIHLYQRKGFHGMGRGRGALGVAMRKDLT